MIKVYCWGYDIQRCNICNSNSMKEGGELYWCKESTLDVTLNSQEEMKTTRNHKYVS